jgi:FtsH-binding integral membrane protein
MGGDACAARLRGFLLVSHADDLGSRRSSDVLGLLRRDGPVNGLHLLVFTGTSIARTFFIAAAMFGTTSLYGYTTKRDLSQFGSFLIMGLIGVVIASLVNLFLASSTLQFVVSIVGILVFIGLTAWDTQSIKEQYAENFGAESQQKLAVLGAFSLYLNFINIFQLLLNFTGQREE